MKRDRERERIRFMLHKTIYTRTARYNR